MTEILHNVLLHIIVKISKKEGNVFQQHVNTTVLFLKVLHIKSISNKLIMS